MVAFWMIQFLCLSLLGVPPSPASGVWRELSRLIRLDHNDDDDDDELVACARCTNDPRNRKIEAIFHCRSLNSQRRGGRSSITQSNKNVSQGEKSAVKEFLEATMHSHTLYATCVHFKHKKNAAFCRKSQLSADSILQKSSLCWTLHHLDRVATLSWVRFQSVLCT